MYSCEQTRELLDQLLDGSLPEEIRSGVERHLAGCDECREIGETLALIADAIPPLEELDPPDHLKASPFFQDRNRQPKLTILVFQTIPIEPASSPGKLNVVQQDQLVRMRDLVEKSRPRQKNGLVCGNDHARAPRSSGKPLAAFQRKNRAHTRIKTSLGEIAFIGEFVKGTAQCPSRG